MDDHGANLQQMSFPSFLAWPVPSSASFPPGGVANSCTPAGGVILYVTGRRRRQHLLAPAPPKQPSQQN